MLHIFSLLRKGENIAYQRQDSEGICYGHIISRPEPHQLIVSLYNDTNSQLNEVTVMQYDFLQQRFGHLTVSSGYRTEIIIYTMDLQRLQRIVIFTRNI